jgi:hypothetical protein
MASCTVWEMPVDTNTCLVETMLQRILGQLMVILYVLASEQLLLGIVLLSHSAINRQASPT